MEKLIQKINEYKNQGIDLFYNSKGNQNAYRLFVRHIGIAETFGYGKINQGILTPNKELHIVDFDKKEIIKTKENIKIIKLEALKGP